MLDRGSMEVAKRITISNIFVISGPSGVGKTTIVRRLLEKYYGKLYYPLTYTTRSARAGEVHGRDMYYVSRAEWCSRLNRGEFAAVNEIYGKLYGTRKDDINAALDRGEKVVMVLDEKGSDDIRTVYSAIHVYLVPPSMEFLRRCLEKRWPAGGEALEERFRLAPKEMEARWKYDYVLVSEDLDTLEKDLEKIFALSEGRDEGSGIPTLSREDRGGEDQGSGGDGGDPFSGSFPPTAA